METDLKVVLLEYTIISLGWFFWMLENEIDWKKLNESQAYARHVFKDIKTEASSFELI